MKVVITAGGTGGHIFPALAILNKIKEKEKDSEFLYIGTTDRMEAKLVPERKIPYFGIPMEGLNRKNIFKNFRVIKKYVAAVKLAKEEIKKFNPDIVIGVGGYISAPVLYAAAKLGYKTMIHEQNSIPGISNKFLSRYVDKVLVSFEDSKEYFPKHKTVYTGNPRSEEIQNIRPISKSELGLSKDKKLVLIVMGSLGSMTMTEKLKKMITSFVNQSYEVLLITGENYFKEYQSLTIPKNVKILPFYKDLIKVMKVTDIMVTRSGASTIAEITSIALPSIMVPSPYVSNNHQMKNALSLEKVGACSILTEDNFNEENLKKEIDNLLTDREKYDKMKKALLKLAKPNSATLIYEEAKKLVRDET